MNHGRRGSQTNNDFNSFANVKSDRDESSSPLVIAAWTSYCKPIAFFLHGGSHSKHKLLGADYLTRTSVAASCRSWRKYRKRSWRAGCSCTLHSWCVAGSALGRRLSTLIVLHHQLSRWPCPHRRTSRILGQCNAVQWLLKGLANSATIRITTTLHHHSFFS